MLEKLKGKLNSKRTRKGFHVVITSIRDGKTKTYQRSVKQFPGELSNLDVEFSLEGNQIVEIKKLSGETLWNAETEKSPKPVSNVHSGHHNSKTRDRFNVNQVLPEIRAHKTSKEFIETSGYARLNPSLKFNRFVAWNKNQGKFDYKDTITGRDQLHLECHPVPNEIQKRISHLITNIRQDFNGRSISWKAETQWRMVIGLGTPHVHETAMTWHHTWSIPYIPGSALKGVTRSYFLMKIWEKFSKAHPGESWENTVPCLEAWLTDGPHPSKVNHNERNCPVFNWAEEELSSDKTTFQLIFGTQGQKGTIVFMDAFPVEKYCLKLDVMNVHYPEYYRGAAPKAADWESPNPVFFLTVVDTTFQGLILIDHKLLRELSPNLTEEKILQETHDLLKEALIWNGVGAKTAVGYGILG